MASFTSPLVKRKLPSDNVGLNGESYVDQYFVNVGMKFRNVSDDMMIKDTLLILSFTRLVHTKHHFSTISTTFDCFHCINRLLCLPAMARKKQPVNQHRRRSSRYIVTRTLSKRTLPTSSGTSRLHIDSDSDYSGSEDIFDKVDKAQAHQQQTRKQSFAKKNKVSPISNCSPTRKYDSHKTMSGLERLKKEELIELLEKHKRTADRYKEDCDDLAKERAEMVKELAQVKLTLKEKQDIIDSLQLECAGAPKKKRKRASRKPATQVAKKVADLTELLLSRDYIFVNSEETTRQAALLIKPFLKNFSGNDDEFVEDYSDIVLSAIGHYRSYVSQQGRKVALSKCNDARYGHHCGQIFLTFNAHFCPC
jgi:hypothetical protein